MLLFRSAKKKVARAHSCATDFAVAALEVKHSATGGACEGAGDSKRTGVCNSGFMDGDW